MIAWLVAASLVVTPPAVDFGSVLVQGDTSDTLTLSNTGASPIVLGEIATDDPAFDAGSRSGDPRPGTIIAPNGSVPLVVSFRPPSIGPHAATLRIASDDPVSPEIAIPLAGTGAVPSISVLPALITLTLTAGDTANRWIWIANPGDVALDWSLAFVPVETAARATRTVAILETPAGGDLAGVTILWDRSHGQQASSFWSTVVGDLVGRGATVTESLAEITPELLDGVRILWSQDAGQAWSGTEIQALEDWVGEGGGLLLEGDNASSIPVFNAITTALGAGVQYTTHSGGQGITTAIEPHPTTDDVHQVEVGLHTAKLASIGAPALELIRDPIEAPVAAAARIGAGRIIALADELLQNPVTGPGRDNRLYGNQVIEWLAGASWISAIPPSGSIAPDSSRMIAVAIDTADLPAGLHRVDATIATNVPDRPEVVIPVTLTLLGRPDIAVSPEALGFGSVVVATTETDTVVVWNAGEELLTISAISVPGSAFTTTGAPSALAPAETLFVPVTFAPLVVGPASGTLTITSDDPDEPTVVVPLSGSGQTDCAGGCSPPSVTPPDVAASNGIRFGLPIVIAESPQAIDAFGFDLEFDPDVLSFADSAAATALTEGFILVSAVEIAPGRVRCAGFGATAIPPGSSGDLARVFLEVDCATCIPGDEASIVVSALTDDLAGMNACCGTFTFSTCSRNGDVNQDGQLSPGDALCAVKIYLNGQTVPAECDVSGDCEVASADANCDSTVTAGDALAIYDAYLAGDAPYPCFAMGGGEASAEARAWLDAAIRAQTEANGAAVAELAVGPTPTSGPISIELAALPGERVRLRIVDVAGRRVRTLHDGPCAGRIRVSWDGRGEDGGEVAAGIYFVRLERDAATLTRRIVLLR